MTTKRQKNRSSPNYQGVSTGFQETRGTELDSLGFTSGLNHCWGTGFANQGLAVISHLALCDEEGLNDKVTHLVDMRQYTTASNGRADEQVELLVASDGELQMSWSDSLDTKVLCGVTCKE